MFRHLLLILLLPSLFDDAHILLFRLLHTYPSVRKDITLFTTVHQKSSRAGRGDFLCTHTMCYYPHCLHTTFDSKENQALFFFEHKPLNIAWHFVGSQKILVK